MKGPLHLLKGVSRSASSCVLLSLPQLYLACRLRPFESSPEKAEVCPPCDELRYVRASSSYHLLMRSFVFASALV